MPNNINDKYLVQFEINMIIAPLVHSQFSKSFLSNSQIPLYVQQCQYSRDLRLYQVQNGHGFGFIPLTDTQKYFGTT